MTNENPNYKPNILSRFYTEIAAKTGATWTDAGNWLAVHYFSLIAAISILLLPAWIWLIVETLGEVFTLTEGSNAGRVAEERRNIAYALGVNITALAALLAAPLIIIRAYINERQTTAAEQGLITDRFTKAVEQLGTEKTVKVRRRYISYIDGATGEPSNWSHVENWDEEIKLPEGAADVDYGQWTVEEETTPNLEVRLGAIYALERIAQDSERDHIPIMETLCAYIRQNAPDREAEDHGLGDWPDRFDKSAGYDDEVFEHLRASRAEKLGQRKEKLEEWANALPAPRVDIQAALSVIGRRGEERIAHERRQHNSDQKDAPGFRLDLRGTNLQMADLTHARLDHALLTEARLEGADLEEARLEGADLGEARLEGAYLEEARLEGADLEEARLEGANLIQTRLEGAYLMEARLEGADLSGARLEEANLMEARLEGANLSGARLEGAHLMRARLEGANLSGARLEGANLMEARLEGADLMEARLEGANLVQARLEGAYLMVAGLERAYLREARLERADLHSADLKFAVLSL